MKEVKPQEKGKPKRRINGRSTIWGFAKVDPLKLRGLGCEGGKSSEKKEKNDRGWLGGP